MSIRRLADFSPSRAILGSFLCAIGCGTALLALPGTHLGSINVLDLFFTATSATCVCGLFTIPLEQFTFWGHCIILLLIQIGGLGLITMSLFVMSLFIDLGMATQFMAGQLLELESWTKIRRLLIFIICLTIGCELLGTGIIFCTIIHDFCWYEALFLSLFQAISSFCNAGISLFPLYQYNYCNNALLLLSSATLMLCGGLGFITWQELLYTFSDYKDKKRHHFSLYSKLVLSWTFSLIAICGVIFWILERDNILSHMSTVSACVHTLLHAISFKSAGLVTFIPINLQLATLLLIMASAFIGSAPGSTGSGIKVTTLAVFLATVRAAIAGKSSTDIAGRHIPADQVYKSMAIIACSIGWILTITFCLLITERQPDFLTVLFEVVSAFTTLGISLGITPSLSILGKIFILASMIIGRIGSLTLLLALRKRRLDNLNIKYPEERIMLG